MARPVGRVHWYGDQLLGGIRKGNPEALFDAGEELRQTAEDKAPTGFTGNLKDSGYVSTTWRSNYKLVPGSRPEYKPNSDETAAVGFSVFYAPYVEFGTKNVGAQPFLRPAIDETGAEVGGKYAAKMKSILKKSKVKSAVR